jgi:hypothetical protein
MADIKISDLTAATTPLGGTEVLPIVQSGVTVKVAVSNLTAGRSVSATAVAITGSTSGTATIVTPAVAGTPTITLPIVTGTLATLAGTETLTNKTLTGAVMNGTVGATTPSTGAFTSLSSTIGSSFAYSSGSVGIGVASPTDSILSVYALNQTVPAISARYSAAGFKTGFSVYNTAGYPYISFNSNPVTSADTATYDLAGAATKLDMGNGSFIFSGAASGSAAGAITWLERMRLTSAGLVGIGTTAPAYKLEVKGASATAGQLSIHDGTGDTTVSGVTAASLLFQARDTSIRTLAEIDAVNTTTNGTAGTMVFQTRISDTLAERARIDSSGNVLVTNVAGLGYGTGAGGTVTQATDKSTAVTLNKPCGTITMNGAALGGLTTVTFTLNNSILAAADTITVNLNSSSGNFVNYTLQASAWAAGTVIIKLRNDTVGSLSDAVQFNFNIHKGATS